ncbi:O-antigen ligase family protein [Thalassotalea euphylliae]|uniref:O-antigen ligase domain-containing protein n=1 Tax=Thalassotalea euphylliae TaxID=1655234 RepID=A0A3E0UL26_9GAMM|nr:O-antigen ligase family protein [Thalassotalea euphylliae]REL36975.1 O-antigen ligase domain-containing protein [Thalassotalea euphylliae]
MKLTLGSVQKFPVELMLIGFIFLLLAITQQAVLMLGVVAIGVAVAGLLPFSRSIQLIIFLIPCLAPFSTNPYLPVSLATLIYLAVLGRYLLTEGGRSQYYLPGIIAALVLIGFELLHIIYNPVVFSSKTIRWLLLFLLVVMLIFDKRKYASFAQLRFAFLLGFVFSTLFGLLSQVFHPEVVYNTNVIQRFSGAAGDPNNFGLFCLLLVFFYLPSQPRERISISQLALCAALLGVGAITVSRSFFLVTSFSLLLYFVLYFRTAIGEMVYRSVVFFAVLVVLGFVLYWHGAATELAIFERFSSDNAADLTGARSTIFVEYLTLFTQLDLSFLLFGAGINGYLGYYNHFFLNNNVFTEVVGPHNTYIELLVSFGLLGSFIFLYFFYLCFKAEKIRTSTQQIYAISLLPLIVFSLYCLSLQNLGKYTSYLLLLMIILNTCRAKHE